MPDFILPDDAGRLTTLQDMLGTGPLVVSFNRGHWCPFCWIELDALASAELQLAERGASVVSIMPDRQEFVRRFPATIRARVRVLTDVDAAYAASLALAFWVDERLQQVMTEQNLSLETFQGSSTWLLPIPATFVVSQDGRVLRRFVDADFRRRMAIADILEALPAKRD
jgi:peroxiredoxin